MASSSASSKPSVGILSIGDMGMGVAKVLLAHGYRVLTVSAGRSNHTIERIRAAKIEEATSDEAFVAQADIILSIAPPRDALAIAKRVSDACKGAAGQRRSTKGPGASNIVYIDLNAISPRTVTKIGAIFGQTSPPWSSPQTPASPSLARRLTRSLSMVGQEAEEGPPPPPITISFLDGGIIGPPPFRPKDKEKQKGKATDKSSMKSKTSSHEAPAQSADATSTSASASASASILDQPNTDSDPSTNPDTNTNTWTMPSIPLSGPHESLLPKPFLDALNMHFISPHLGTASALKSCFASLTKGFTALSVLAYTTAATCGVLPQLQSQLDAHAPGVRARAERGLVGMPPKAHRWTDEMREIGTTLATSAGLEPGRALFAASADVFGLVAQDPVLGAERVGKRKRGLTAEDVAGLLEEGVNRKIGRVASRRDEKLELAWRGSWGL